MEIRANMLLYKVSKNRNDVAVNCKKKLISLFAKNICNANSNDEVAWKLVNKYIFSFNFLSRDFFLCFENGT